MTTDEARRQIVLMSEAICRATPGTTPVAAYDLARQARPDLARMLDSQALLSEPVKPKLTATAHERLVELAEEIRANHPALTHEGAYLAAWQANPKVVAALAAEQHTEQERLALSERARVGRIHFGERGDRDRAYEASWSRPLTPTAHGDQAANANHPRWLERAKQLVRDGRFKTVEQAYAHAMTEPA